jgi:hypothetical protein
MVKAALAARGAGSTPAPTSSPSAQGAQTGPLPQQPGPASAAPAWDPNKPRPKPGTPEYEAMVQAALAARSGGGGAVPTTPLASPPAGSDPYQAPPPPAAPAAPAWDPNKPRPKPGTPEYEAMVQAMMSQQGGAPATTQPQPQQPPPPAAAPAWDPNKPRPKPGTPEYEAMVQAALKARSGQNPGTTDK